MSQNYSNHRRYFALYHFVLQPLLVANVIVQALRLYKSPGAYQAWMVVFAIAVILLSLTARIMALKVQNRLVRLEERLRLEKILPPQDQALISKLRTGQLIALRFASDEEVPDLVRKTVAGEFNTNTEIKKAIKTWRPDYLRV